jgi:hypothetical protein
MNWLLAASGGGRRLMLLVTVLAIAAIAPYLPFLGLPPISDDYLQITLSRDFVSADGLPKLIGDALYRCRATSLVWTRAIDATTGEDIAIHRLGSLLLHFLNGILLVLFGSIPAIGYRRAFLVALAFLLMNGYQEAIIWVAAVHDLLVFGFAMASLLCWIHWLRTRKQRWLLLVFPLFLLALYSKESAAVLPMLYGAAWFVVGDRRREDLWPILLAPLFTLIYSTLIFQTAHYHLHMNDGSFSFSAPFWLTLPRTLFRVLVPWSLVAIGLLLWKREFRVVGVALVFGVLTMLPYSFLTYNTEAPSRHRYWATAAAALLLAWALDLLWMNRARWQRAVAASLAISFAITSPVYLVRKKLPQYQQRAMPTEDFLRFARDKQPPVWIGQGSYHAEIYRHAARVMLGWQHDDVKSVEEQPAPDGVPIFEAPE